MVTAGDLHDVRRRHRADQPLQREVLFLPARRHAAPGAHDAGGLRAVARRACVDLRGTLRSLGRDRSQHQPVRARRAAAQQAHARRSCARSATRASTAPCRATRRCSTSARAHALLEAGLQRICINVGDATPTTRTIYKLPCEKTRDNILRFHDLAGGACQIYIVLVNHRERSRAPRRACGSTGVTTA